VVKIWVFFKSRLAKFTALLLVVFPLKGSVSFSMAWAILRLDPLAIFKQLEKEFSLTFYRISS
jgi:hypothetical protein